MQESPNIIPLGEPGPAWLAQWRECAEKQASADLRSWMLTAAADASSSALHTVFRFSPYLSRLLIQHPDILKQCATLGADATAQSEMTRLRAQAAATDDQAAFMRLLRLAKGRMALLAACADIAGWWSLPQVTQCLSEFADLCVELSLTLLLISAHRRGDIILPIPEHPLQASGIIILGMGKLGAYELNYSSDIDLIIFYEKERIAYPGRLSEQKFMNRLSHDLVMLLQERTKDGYVFRTDLRLRPDPASTPPAVTVTAALYYYESVGQNWERAAMIKARQITGDREAGQEFMRQLIPFMWRRHLDFAAINDIHSIKRQMDHRLGAEISVPGHNIKLGLGGIREIEFYVQVHQLIWGGREPALRLRGTCETLNRLCELGLIDENKRRSLTEAYVFLRTLEHRLQMVEDQQTHSLPEQESGILHIARFMGFDDIASFGDLLTSHLHAVHTIFASSFRTADTLGDEGNLVFTGTNHDPGTISTLTRLGYKHPEAVSDTVMGWHHGSRRCTRTKRARELLTELMPALLKHLAETANPDAAFIKFDEFLRHLPAGVQLFSLFTANTGLLKLIADIMGSAPMLAETLSRHPDLIEGVLYAGFYDPLPDKPSLSTQLERMLEVAAHLEEKLDMLRRFKNEKQFQAGVQLLRGMITAEASGPFLSDLADVILAHTLAIVQEEFSRTYGRIEGSRFCILALGKLGSREVTFGSDLDLVFIYDVPDFDRLSDGEKPYSASVYYNRFSQRLLSAITSLSKEGLLYEVDTRLRPSGKQGLLAVSFQAMRHYFTELAWTFEFMALTKGRVCVGDASLIPEVDRFIQSVLSTPRDAQKLAADAQDMRERTAKEFPAANHWDIKYARGGLMDVDFIAQFLLLRHAAQQPKLLKRSSADILEAAQALGLLPDNSLANDNRFLVQLFNMLRLSAPGDFNPDTALPGLKTLLAKTLHCETFTQLEDQLRTVESRVEKAYKQWIA